ncbi:MAG: FG-GAP repeat protein, partial [Myxococcota bacterium]
DAENAGAVYLFVRTGGRWSQRTYIKASNTDAGDAFGRALALSGNTLAVGAHLEDSSARGVEPEGGQEDNDARDSGAVYVSRIAP